MILKIILFELNYWKKRVITYVFPLMVFGLSIMLLTLEGVSFGSDIAYRNSPNSLTVLYFFILITSPLFINAFVSSSITRDYEYKLNQIFYSLPISKFQLYLGRFIGSSIVVSFMFIGIYLADIIGQFLPWVEPNMLGPTNHIAHLKLYFAMALPAMMIVGSILFLIAAMTKNINNAFLGAIGIVVIYISLLNLTDSLDNDKIAAILDPMGYIPISLQTKKWTAFEKNNSLFILDKLFWLNKAFWALIAALLWGLALYFSDKELKFFTKKKKISKVASQYNSTLPLATSSKDFSLKSRISTIYYQAKVEAISLLKSPSFIVIAGLMLMILAMRIIGMISDDRTNSIATTSNTINLLKATIVLFKIGAIFLAGNLIWRERDNKVNEIMDTLPTSNWTVYLGKLFALLSVSIFLFGILTLFGIGYQLFNGVYAIELGLYFKELFLIDMFDIFTIAIIAMFIQLLINNKFIAFFLTLLIVFAEDYFLDWVKIQSNLYGLTPRLPSHIYSDFYGFGPYATGLFAFALYWILVSLVIAYISNLLFMRGKETHWSSRWSEFKSRLKQSKVLGLALMSITLLYGGFMYYQTQVLNPYFGTKDEFDRQAYYEKTFKKYQNMPIPKIYHVDYKIDLYPEERKIVTNGLMNFVNKSDTVIDKIIVNKNPFLKTEINIKGAILISTNDKSNLLLEEYQIPALAIGDSMTMNYTLTEEYHGIENNITNNRLLPNGTFMDVSSITPIFGYIKGNEIDDKSEREKRGLPVKAENMPALEKNCGKNCMQDYLKSFPSDWATIHTVISTSASQTAIAPGNFVKNWKEKGRNYFEYTLEQPSKFFFSIVSAEFKVLKDTVKGVSCEVYYLDKHEYNTKEMLKALKRSISYYSEQFGAYKHKQARIIEFPRFSSFAQAFPGTMPYSEEIGFVSNLSKNPKDINEIFHVVAHEMAHQWWAHQVVGAYMQGATLLSESLAEYSSLKLLEIEYGKDMVAKFLKDANYGYIFGRANESKKESSLLQVDNQGYIHYRKGSVVLYGIQQILGVDKFNCVLKEIATAFAYKEPPYPTSYELYDRLLAASPDSIKYLVKDGIANIIIYKTDITKVTTQKQSDGNYKTIVKMSIVKNSSDPNAKQEKDLNKILIGQSQEVPLNDYMDIGLFEKEGDKERYGKEIVLQRFRINNKENELTFITNKKPYKVVVDPYFIYIHKEPQDNIEKI